VHSSGVRLSSPVVCSSDLLLPCASFGMMTKRTFDVQCQCRLKLNARTHKMALMLRDRTLQKLNTILQEREQLNLEVINVCLPCEGVPKLPCHDIRRH
jgi:hypothetical protein